MSWIRRRYGAGPWHLLGSLACFLVTAYALAKVLGESGWKEILVLFAVCVVAHDLVAWPVYGLADRAAVRLDQRQRRRGSPGVPWINHIRVPSIISALLLIMFFPLVLRLSSAAYLADTGFTEQAYLFNWLAVTGILFAGSALLYLVRVALAGRRREPDPG